jgi:hypothetical protein
MKEIIKKILADNKADNNKSFRINNVSNTGYLVTFKLCKLDPIEEVKLTLFYSIKDDVALTDVRVYNTEIQISAVIDYNLLQNLVDGVMVKA